MFLTFLLVFWTYINTVYSESKEKQGDNFPASLKYIYGTKTSNTSLRPHLEKVHFELYMQLKKDNGWKTQLPGQATEARSQATSGSNSAQGVQDVFDEHTFHRYLVNFIVADDQVSFVCLRFLIELMFVCFSR